MLRAKDFIIRDPYVVADNGKYYLYSRRKPDTNCLHMVVYESVDLVNWSNPKTVFYYETNENTHLQCELWAPEIHKYNGKFYAFLSAKNITGKRGTYVAVCDTPDGEFKLLNENKPITPVEKSCIDGTLYIEDGTPYVIYSRDWPDNYIEEKGYYVGQICGVEVNKELTEIVGEPFLLFESNELELTKDCPNVTMYEGALRTRYGSDAPFLQKLSNGSLFLTWSPVLDKTYVVLGAISKSGKIKGEWEHLTTPIFAQNGGHAMFFDGFDGKRKMLIHHPEFTLSTHANFFDVEEIDGKIEIIK